MDPYVLRMANSGLYNTHDGGDNTVRKGGTAFTVYPAATDKSYKIFLLKFAWKGAWRDHNKQSQSAQSNSCQRNFLKDLINFC